MPYKTHVFWETTVAICIVQFRISMLNPIVTNGLSHPYHLDESTFNFRGVGGIFFYIPNVR